MCLFIIGPSGGFRLIAPLRNLQLDPSVTFIKHGSFGTMTEPVFREGLDFSSSSLRGILTVSQLEIANQHASFQHSLKHYDPA